jgi:hypothetical protein
VIKAPVLLHDHHSVLDVADVAVRMARPRRHVRRIGERLTRQRRTNSRRSGNGSSDTQPKATLPLTQVYCHANL